MKQEGGVRTGVGGGLSCQEVKEALNFKYSFLSAFLLMFGQIAHILVCLVCLARISVSERKKERKEILDFSGY